MTDYREQLDPASRTMLDALNAGFPAVELMDGAQARAAVAARRQPVENPEAVGSVTNAEIPGPGGLIPVRIYQPAKTQSNTPVIVFAHGGGFVFCDLDSHDGICRALCNGASAVVMSVDYRLAPEHPSPAAAEDVYAALRWAAEHAAEFGADPGRLIIAGDSAGGHLAAVASLISRDRGGPAVAAQVLIYPVIDADFETPSYREFAEGWFNTRAAMTWYWEQYSPSGFSELGPEAKVSGLPTTVLITAGRDPLCSEGEDFGRRLADSGVRVIHRRYEHIFHGFMTIASLPVTTAALQTLYSDIVLALGE
ncbi:alpha/beta hydrolase [Rhodococcus sp. NPDC056743]|uniref:alpha/beta hydrolase n=1 Tax=Rhodococcus sp. NPDC056743 TaxID=3345934 RepID=UPI00366E0C57